MKSFALKSNKMKRPKSCLTLRLAVSPEDDVDRLEPGRDVGLGDLRSVRLQQMGLRGFNVRDRRCQALPEAQQVVNTVGGELPVLRRKSRSKESGTQHCCLTTM